MLLLFKKVHEFFRISVVPCFRYVLMNYKNMQNPCALETRMAWKNLQIQFSKDQFLSRKNSIIYIQGRTNSRSEGP